MPEQPEKELISGGKEISQSCDCFSDHFALETGAEVTVGLWWAGLHLRRSCLAMCTSHFSLSF